MAFDDTFPYSLSLFEGPKILEAQTVNETEEDDLHFESMLFDAPDLLPNSYRSQDKSRSCQNLVNPSDLGLSHRQAPKSLLDSSSSDSSNDRHEQNHLSESSGSVITEDGHAPALYGTTGPNGIYAGESSTGPYSKHKSLSPAEYESSNRAMERDFDFSLASSPCEDADSTSDLTPSPNSLPGRLKTKPTQLAFRSSAESSIAPNNSIDQVKPDPAASSSKFYTHTHCMAQAQRLSMELPGPQSYSAIPNEVPHGLGALDIVSGYDTRSSINPISILRSSGVAMTLAPPQRTSGSVHHPALHLYPMPPKSRVETQIPLKMTLYPVPQGVKKLHLQTYSVAKEKHVRKPTPAKSPDMLELHAMLVCATAMRDPEKRRLAFARASNPRPLTPTDNFHLSSANCASSKDDEQKPVNGGSVNICHGCIVRERKRTARKREKNIEEEQSWQRDETKRSINFNTPEVQTWSKPSPPKDRNDQFTGPEIRFPDKALQVDLPMRITCYCRHHEEKIGYQFVLISAPLAGHKANVNSVIFTLRNHEDAILTQIMTHSIMMTDDHKATQPKNIPPYQIGSFPETVMVDSAGVIQQMQLSTQNLVSSRHSYSTTDLQGVQQNIATPRGRPYAVSQNSSPSTSACTVSKSLSRPASPLVPCGQQNKRRKRSNSGRIRSELTMTKLHTSTLENTGKDDTSSSNQSMSLASAAIATSTPASTPTYGQAPPAIPILNGTISSMSVSTEGSYLHGGQNSQSVESLPELPGVCPSDSVGTSCCQSPIFGNQDIGLPQHQGPTLVDRLYSMPITIYNEPLPVIGSIMPAKGPKAGGIEVACLGSGFNPGLEIMFGNNQATITRLYGETALSCLVPPALQPGPVMVTFRNIDNQNRAPFFQYTDDDEHMLMELALNMINQKWNGSATNAGDSARNIIQFLVTNGSSSTGSNQGGTHQRSPSNGNAARLSMTDLETAVFSCLELVDLDDSPFQANLDIQGATGQSMLHLSSSLGHYRLAAGLLARGADPDIRDNNGMSPMHMASLHGHSRIIRKLRLAGADPTLRSLNGFTPADMTGSQIVRDASDAFEQHTRPRSAGTNPAGRFSRGHSAPSLEPMLASSSRAQSRADRLGLENDYSGQDIFNRAFRSHNMTPAQSYSRSRRNSMSFEQLHLDEKPQDGLCPNASLMAANPAFLAFRAQISAQIQQLQQSVHRSLPMFQIPTFLPMPNLPDCQAYPVVRKISSLVPQRNPRISTVEDSPKPTKEPDYHWWELLTGAASSPPAYDEIYPEKAQNDRGDEKLSVLRTAGELLIDQKCKPRSYQAESSSIMETVDLGSSNLTRQQREQLRIAHAMKVKKLRSDRNLFFIWIPLLVLVLVLMLKDRVPKAIHIGYQAFQYARGQSQGARVVEV